MSRAHPRRLTHAEAVHLIARAQRKPIGSDHLYADKLNDGDLLYLPGGTETVVRHRTEQEVKP